MSIKQAFLLSLRSLRASKMRSFLTMLGIVIGVSSVIILVTLINSLSLKMIGMFESIGTNLISVNLGAESADARPPVTPEDMQRLVDDNPEILAAMSPAAYQNYSISNGDVTFTTPCLGVSHKYSQIGNSHAETGRFLSYMDIKARQKNCVIGSYVANTLFPGQDPLGQTIKIGGANFHVVGVMPAEYDSREGTVDAYVYIPYNALGSGLVFSYNFSAASKDTVPLADALIQKFLLDAYGGDEDLFYLYTQADMLKELNQLTGIMSTVLVGIAAISLLVGGIGIMNIMLVSVTERTREIGIRKSLGATPWDIMSQFVVEAITTSSIGGLLGIGLGILLSSAVVLFGLPVALSMPSILISFGVSAGIGVLFGYFPAKKAARMNPIDALRFD